MARSSKKATSVTSENYETDWADLPVNGWRIRRRADGSVQVQSTNGASSLSLPAQGWQEALEPLLFGGPVVDTAADTTN